MPNPVGRPTKYNDEMQAQADAYVTEWADFDAIPSRVGLCCYLGISKQTSFEWERHYPEFLATLQAVDTLQERTGVNKGITGEFNSTITKLVLANHGYSDRQSLDHTTNGEAMQSVVVLPSKQ